MPRPAWSLYAYQLIVPDEQLDLFACREVLDAERRGERLPWSGA
jgi:hypothetical protein